MARLLRLDCRAAKLASLMCSDKGSLPQLGGHGGKLSFAKSPIQSGGKIGGNSVPNCSAVIGEFNSSQFTRSTDLARRSRVACRPTNQLAKFCSGYGRLKSEPGISASQNLSTQSAQCCGLARACAMPAEFSTLR